MDPDSCWKRFLDHCEEGDRAEARWALKDLLEWANKGGKCPEGVTLSVITNLKDWLNRN